VKTAEKGECATKGIQHYDVLISLDLLEQIICWISSKWKLSTEIKIKVDLYGYSTRISPVNKNQKLSTCGYYMKNFFKFSECHKFIGND